MKASLIQPIRRVRDLLRRPERVRASYRRVFLSPEGQIVLADLAQKCRFYGQNAQVDSPYETYYLLGLRGAYLHVLEQLDVSGDEAARRIREGVDDVADDTEAA